MRISQDQLPGLLEKGVRSFFLVSGEEPLLIEEASDAVRAAARREGYAERRVFTIDRGFDWNAIRSAAQSPSLFAERQIFELRLPTGRPDKGGELLLDLIERPVPDTVLLVVTGKLDRKALEASWVRAAQDKGVWLPIRAVPPDALPGWLIERARRSNLRLDSDAAQMIAARVEGNLLAAAQEIDKLGLLATDSRIGVDLVAGSVGDSARFDVFDLSEAAAAGDAARALQILDSLEGEGVEPTLILWALGRSLRGLWQTRERRRLRTSGAGSGWNLAAAPSDRALARVRDLPLAELMREAARADQIVKGAVRGDARSAVRALTAGLAGALPRSMTSG